MFPNYMQVLPKTEGNEVAMNRIDFLGALDRISVFTSITDSPCVVLTFSHNGLTLNSGDTEAGSAHDEIPVKYDGNEIAIRFNPAYIRDVLTAMDEDEIVMKIAGVGPSVIRKSESDDYTYVVMPLRV